jgi:hypothetical protein
MPTVDVGIPTYGSPKYLAQAIESVLAQTHRDLILRVFDNGPGDGEAASVLGRYRDDPRVRHVPSGDVLTQAQNLTRAIRGGAGPYVAVLHDDDVWDPEYLERRVAFLDAHSDCGFVFSSMREIDETGAVLLEVPHRLPEGLHAPRDFVPLFLDEMVVGTPTALFRRTAVQQAEGYYDERFLNNDWEFWLRIAIRNPVGYLAVRDCGRRLHTSSQTAANKHWGAEELRLVDAFEQLVAGAPDIDWPLRARRRRRASGHIMEALDALVADETPAVRRHLVAALRAHPAAVVDPRLAAAGMALAGGRRGRRLIEDVRARRARPGHRALPVHAEDLRRALRDALSKIKRG